MNTEKIRTPVNLVGNTRLKSRFKYIVRKIGINPMELGFEFQFFWNGRSMTFSKKIKDEHILLSMNYWNGDYYLTIYRDSFQDMRFSFDSFNKYPITYHNIQRIVKIVERTKTRGVTGYWYTCDAGYLKFQFDETRRKTMMVCKSFKN